MPATYPNADLLEGAEVRVPSRPWWGPCRVVSACDRSLLRVYVPALGRELAIGRAAVERVGLKAPDL